MEEGKEISERSLLVSKLVKRKFESSSDGRSSKREKEGEEAGGQLFSSVPVIESNSDFLRALERVERAGGLISESEKLRFCGSSSDSRSSKRAEEGEEDGDRLFFGARVVKPDYFIRAIKMSRFISEPRKLRLLEQNRHGSNHVSPQDRVVLVAKSIQKHRNLMLLEQKRHGNKHVPYQDRAAAAAKCRRKRTKLKGEEHVPLFRTDMRLVARVRFGQPIFRSFSEMISEYYRRIHGVDLEVKSVQSNSCKGPLEASDCAQAARWFHVNFTAIIKDDEDGGSVKEYCAVLVLFSFRLAPLLCKITASFPVASSGSDCPCLFEGHENEIRHPSVESSHQCNYAAGSSFRSQILFDMLQQFFGMKGYPISSKLTIKKPRDLPEPKKFMGTECNRKGEGAEVVRLKHLALEMTRCVLNSGKPRKMEEKLEAGCGTLYG
ncbi:hypothetical protein M5689_008655 [Euphorbia peplus]|nr:hypothetical protein M5689_008655 [Euphorbia peplus]